MNIRKVQQPPPHDLTVKDHRRQPVHVSWVSLIIYSAVITGLILMAITFTFSTVAGAQVSEDQTPSFPNTTEVGRLDNVEAGSQCRLESLNNESVYGPGLGGPDDPGNQLIIERGDGSLNVFDIEREIGEDVVWEFEARGGDIVALIGYYVWTSEEYIPIVCDPPPNGSTTTTICPIADSEITGFCGHGCVENNDCDGTTTTSTTTSVPPPPVTDPPPSTTVPPNGNCDPTDLACTGPGDHTEGAVKGALAIVAAGGFVSFVAGRYRKAGL